MPFLILCQHGWEVGPPRLPTRSTVSGGFFPVLPLTELRLSKTWMEWGGRRQWRVDLQIWTPGFILSSSSMLLILTEMLPSYGGGEETIFVGILWRHRGSLYTGKIRLFTSIHFLSKTLSKPRENRPTFQILSSLSFLWFARPQSKEVCTHPIWNKRPFQYISLTDLNSYERSLRIIRFPDSRSRLTFPIAWYGRAIHRLETSNSKLVYKFNFINTVLEKFLR